jgi:hypothetical protein
MHQKRCENLIKLRSQIWTGSEHLKITTPPTNSFKKIKYIKNYWLERSGASDAYSCIFEKKLYKILDFEYRTGRIGGNGGKNQTTLKTFYLIENYLNYLNYLI